MKKAVFTVWVGVPLGLFGAAAVSGYSPFGDGVQERDVYSSGGGPRHK